MANKSTEPKLSSFEIKEIQKFIRDIGKESDRAAVIISAAKLDLQLCQIIGKFLLPCPNSRDELLETDGPLGTLSARIDFCLRAGLITALFAKSLHIVRKIRNQFAHELVKTSLNSGSHRDRVKELVAPFKNNPFFDKLKIGKYDPSSDFRMAVALMTIRLSAVHDKCVPLTNSKAFSLIPHENKSRIESKSPAS